MNFLSADFGSHSYLNSPSWFSKAAQCCTLLGSFILYFPRKDRRKRACKNTRQQLSPLPLTRVTYFYVLRCLPSSRFTSDGCASFPVRWMTSWNSFKYQRQAEEARGNLVYSKDHLNVSIFKQLHHQHIGRKTSKLNGSITHSGKAITWCCYPSKWKMHKSEMQPLRKEEC